jgi:hypothetical protein
MWGTTPPCAKLTGDSGNGFQAALIGDCRLFRPLAENQPQDFLGLLQHYRHLADVCMWAGVRFAPILLQKSKVASVRIFGETLKREAIYDSDNLSRVTEVAYEFSVRR